MLLLGFIIVPLIFILIIFLLANLVYSIITHARYDEYASFINLDEYRTTIV